MHLPILIKFWLKKVGYYTHFLDFTDYSDYDWCIKYGLDI